MSGRCAIVLHSHLPWVAHHGSWPVGEEWLYQAWAASYLPLTAMLGRLADEGRRDVLTLGVTPILAAQLDDPYCLAQFGTWLATWQLRAEGAAVRGVPTAAAEGTAAAQALTAWATTWRHGGSPVLRALADSGVVEILGGPAAHGFTPFLGDRMAAFALAAGLSDAALRRSAPAAGIWAPECAYAPGLEDLYARHNVTHFLVDGPTVGGDTGAPVDVAGSGVLAFARDLDVAYRVWSPSAGYPGAAAYRDFHTFDHDSGLRPAAVTARDVEPQDKRPYDPAAAGAQVARDVADFVDTVVARLAALPQDDPLVVVAYDTELYGHWWHEGPAFLEGVLRALPAAGVELTTLCAAGQQLPARKADLPAGSWGSGKDFGVWEVPELRAVQDETTGRLLRHVDARPAGPGAPGRCGRDEALDQLARETLLTLASDWPFCVTKDSAADYARHRVAGHATAAAAIADALDAGDRPRAQAAARTAERVDRPFGHLDARALRRP